jgi:hypothetical protein
MVNRNHRIVQDERGQDQPASKIAAHRTGTTMPKDARELDPRDMRVSARMCKQVSVSLPYRGDSHDDQYDDYTGATGSTSC